MESSFSYCKMSINSPNYATADAKPQWIPEHTVEPLHIKFELTIFPEEERLEGKVTHHFKFLEDFTSPLKLNAQSLIIHKVTENGKELEFSNTGEHLEIDVNAKKGDEKQIVISYEAIKPRAGIYFVNPDNAYPNISQQVWTQGQDEDTQFYAPVLDNPIWKSTTEVIGKIPKNWTSLSNGDLISDKTEGNWRIMHWKFNFKHSVYLVTFAAGDLFMHEEEADGIKIRWYAQKGREKEAENAYRETGKILKFFSEYTKFPYPYGSYSQWSASRFIFGGMENTSATTQTDLTLRDNRATLDSTSSDLVAHEAAHQWFGDWITAKSWSHAWLHESFATYFNALYVEHSLGKEEFAYRMLQNAEAYFNENKRLYKRPIVTNIYAEPIDIFDAHLYPGGSWRVHMLRRILGEENFREGLRLYLERHGQSHVETIDLARAFEEVSGKPLDWFFDQWLFKAGFPIFEITYNWDEKSKMAKLNIVQSQKVDKKTNDVVEVFRVPTSVQFALNGKKIEFPIEINGKEQTFFFTLPEKPKYVRFDPKGDVLCKVKFKKSQEMLISQLQNDEEIIGQIRAIEELAKKPNPEVLKALEEKLSQDSTFWGVKERIAKALGNIANEEAKQILLRRLQEKHPKARRAIVASLSAFTEDKEVGDALVDAIEKGDESYFVEAELLRSLGYIRDTRALEMIPKGMKKETYNDIAIIKGLQGLAELKTEQVFDIVAEYAKYGMPELGRNEAVRLLGKLGHVLPSRTDKALDLLKKYSKDKLFRVKLACITALQELGDPRGLQILEDLKLKEADGRIRKMAYFAKNKINKSLKKPEELKVIQDKIEELTKENIKLRERLDKIENSS